MLFVSLGVLIPALWFLPWWTLSLLGFAAGFLSGPSRQRALQFSLCAGLVWAAEAFIKDGKNAGVISQRLSGLFDLPSVGLVFAVVFVVGFVTAFLFFQAAAGLSVLSKAKTISKDSSVPK